MSSDGVIGVAFVVAVNDVVQIGVIQWLAHYLNAKCAVWFVDEEG